MKRVLIISFYFPPYTGIAGHRASSWATHFKKHGLAPIVVTRHWEKGGQNTWMDSVPPYGDSIEKTVTDEYELYRVPHRHRPGYKWNGNKKIKAVRYWLAKLKGHIMVDADGYTSFKSICEKILKESKVDYILVSSGPLNLIRLGHELAHQFQIPFIADFRDTHNNKLLKDKTNLSLQGKLDARIFEFYLKKWLQNADLITGVSQPVVDLMKKFNSNKSMVIFNGFEEELFEEMAKQPSSGEKFTITVLGNLFKEQNLELMVRGFQKFIAANKDVLIQFIGTGGSEAAVTQLIRNNIPAENLLLTNFIDRKEALQRAACSHLLYYAGWRGYHGIYSGKIFEYLGLRKNILLAPSDKDVLEALLMETKSGKFCDSEEEMLSLLSGWYAGWKQNGQLEYDGDETAIRNYTRELQAEKLAKKILTMQEKEVLEFAEKREAV